jgi:hypothetical protein
MSTSPAHQDIKAFNRQKVLKALSPDIQATRAIASKAGITHSTCLAHLRELARDRLASQHKAAHGFSWSRGPGGLCSGRVEDKLLQWLSFHEAVSIPELRDATGRDVRRAIATCCYQRKIVEIAWTGSRANGWQLPCFEELPNPAKYIDAKLQEVPVGSPFTLFTFAQSREVRLADAIAGVRRARNIIHIPRYSGRIGGWIRT